MNDEIRVHVVDYGRKNLYMRYVDPLTGRAVARSAGTHLKRDAERAAAKWEAELREGRFKPLSRITWEEFKDRHQKEAAAGLAERTQNKYIGTFLSVESAIRPDRMCELTAERISRWQQSLRGRNLSEATIKSYTAHLKAALNWARDVGMLHTVPKIRMPARAKNSKLMKGRPVTGEEFERMIKKVAAVVGNPNAPAWTHLLRGLWWSGLRLGEALALTWDGHGLHVEMMDGIPYLNIPARHQKSNRDELLVIAPEFAEMLLAVPQADRTGFVFRTPLTGHESRRVDTVSKFISAIGGRAGVVVDRAERAGHPHVKHASAHDLRRAFGTRWAARVMPDELQKLMRHESITTTLKFYVARNAKSLAERLRTLAGNTSGNTSTEKAEPAGNETPETIAGE